MQYFIITWLVTTVSLLILSRLKIGLDLDDLGVALVAALVLGLLNATVRPVLAFLTFPINFLTLGLFSFVISGFILWLTSAFVKGFELRGCLPAIVVAILLAVLNGALFYVLGWFGLA